MVGIYKITNPKGRVYIGQSTDIEKRQKQYRGLSNFKNQIRLYNSYKRYGVNKHIFEVVEECLEEDLNSRERYWQDYFNVTGKQGLNCKLQAGNGKSGKLAAEVKLKIGRANKGKLKQPVSKETREKIALAKRGKSLTEGHKRKIAEGNKGKKLTEETKKRIGKGNKGKLTGRKRSRECIEKRLKTRELNGANKRVSEFFKGKRIPESVRDKISKTMTGRKQTPEHIENAAKAKYKPILHVESGIVYPSRKAAEAAFNKTLDYGLKKGVFRYI